MKNETVLQAIISKYLSPTNSRGARVKASAFGGSVTIGWDHALDPQENHRAAAQALLTKLGWTGSYVHGVLPSGDHAFVAGQSDTFMSHRGE